MIKCEISIRKRSWTSAWWTLRLTFGASTYKTDGRISRYGVDLQDRCFGAVFRAVEDLADVSGVAPETLCVEGWDEFVACAKQMAKLCGGEEA